MTRPIKLQLLACVFLTLIYIVNADPITLIATNIKTIIDAVKIGKSVVDILGNYPVILVEQILASFGKNSPLPPRSYDFIIDLTRPTDIFDKLKAYPISFPLSKQVYDTKMLENTDRFVVNVVGRYNVGKTYVLRLLANINLGDSFTERTVGVSVSLPSPKDTDNTPLALIDTAGTRTPVSYGDETFKEKSYQRQISDSFIQEIAFNSAEVFVLVVNQLTLDDQLYLKTLTQRLKEKGLNDRDLKQQLLIVHNYFNLQTVAEIEKVEEAELKGLFNARKHLQGYWLSKNFKHFVLAHTDSPAGHAYNTRAIENIRTMIKGANAATNPDVLSKIVGEVELLLGKVLVEKEPENIHDASQEQRSIFSVFALFQSGRKGKLEVFNKHQVHVELEVKNVTVQSMEPLWFICPKQLLSDNVSLSNELRFNQDGSIYVDFSSQFVPDFNIFRLNEDGDVGIHIECPTCVRISAKRKTMTSIIVQGEKLNEPSKKQYLNTRRIGKFEIEISLEKLEEGLILNIGDMETTFNDDGLIKLVVPSDKKGKKNVDKDAL